MKPRIFILLLGCFCWNGLIAQCNFIKYRNPLTDENGYITKTLSFPESFENSNIRVRIKREGDLYLLKILLYRNSPIEFSIEKDHPLAFSLEGGTLIKAYPYQPVSGKKEISELISSGVVGYLSIDAEIEFKVDENDMKRLAEGYISGIRLYYSSKHMLPGSEVDDLGYYLFWDLRRNNKKGKPVKKHQKVNDKLDGLFQCILEAE